MVDMVCAPQRNADTGALDLKIDSPQLAHYPSFVIHLSLSLNNPRMLPSKFNSVPEAIPSRNDDDCSMFNDLAIA